MSTKVLLRLISLTVLLSVSAFAVDGVVLINQATVMAAGGFPYKISQPGSYKLSGNLSVPAGMDGIDINSDNVTLDLNGFSIVGPGVCDGDATNRTTACTGEIAGTGVVSHNNEVTIRSGSVRGMLQGILVQGEGNLVEEVHASKNVVAGIVANSGEVRRCTANNNGDDGIISQGAIVTENSLNGNGSQGINATSSSVINNVMTDNPIGLLLQLTVFGSNAFFSNSIDVVNAGGVSQNNNVCSGHSC